MTGKPLAHSARPGRGIPAQDFWEHIANVERAAAANAARATAFWTGDHSGLCSDVTAAARFHDCGKLAPENQEVLARSSKDPLPIRHEDAGSAVLLNAQRTRAAMLVASHHAGLPSLSAEKAKRLYSPPTGMYRFAQATQHTERHSGSYAAEYRNAGLAAEPRLTVPSNWSGLAHRIALSCLVDADHSDTARHYAEATPETPAEPRWRERAEALDEFVEQLQAGQRQDARTADRRDLYTHCRDATPSLGILSCAAPVGSGKTTAVMAHLLRTAAEKKLRHIFVVLPYTNIIQQSVDVYRKALVLPGEDPEKVVAEVHHRAEFETPDLREMSVLWNAPITVLTAVQFFETIAGNKPARLRKLHELPGSAIFIDEAHAAIPIQLWPQTWLWLRELASEWRCHFVLASGSLAKFWENPDIVEPAETIPDLLAADLKSRLESQEQNRLKIRSHPGPLNCTELARLIQGQPGPRVAIVNTVQSAAVLAKRMRDMGHDVLHLSTALAPQDRQRILDRIRERLQRRDSTDWTLVATSCVEAGVDLSFRTAVRESCSVASVIQTGGRVNRHGEWPGAAIWDVRLQDPNFNRHPAFEASRMVLKQMLEGGEMDVHSPATVTEALRRELKLRDVSQSAEEIKSAEASQEFPRVAELYNVITSDTKTVIVDPALVHALEAGRRLPWQQLLRGSVQIWSRKVADLAIRRLDWDENLFVWTAPYEPDFLGYMAGVLPLIEGRDTGLFA